ncbi:ACT domain-containing protein [Candidatus Bathyarchaeota archaeon]|nr:ACT domain-containing protein [Candidatus Bathyarchaeota archaeon]MBS7612814.1 ACT domain-containing protein [Candidatus Bathyarchaeota archaeon]
MRIASIQKIDSKGRISIPVKVREALGLKEGMRILLIADVEERKIAINPFADPDAKLVEFKISLNDVPGALARAASILAKNGIDLLFSESRTLRRGEHAEWIAIADYSKCLKPLEKIGEELISEKCIKAVEHKPLE